jgi:hypothetical protein
VVTPNLRIADTREDSAERSTEGLFAAPELPGIAQPRLLVRLDDRGGLVDA